MMISTIVSYVSYSQIWVNIDKKNLRLTGSTNRSTLVFENDFINIQESYIFSITNNRSDETRNFEL